MDNRFLMPVTLPAEIDSDEDGQQPIFSLVTGQYRKAKRFGSVVSSVGGGASSAVIPRNTESAVSVSGESAAGGWQHSKPSRHVS